MTLRFGTDGIRGVAGVDLTPELVAAIGRAAARVLGPDVALVIARDTRLSGPTLEAALTVGLRIEGASAVSLGVLPTPGLAFVCRERAAPGAMISASHNPFPDNGVKFFTSDGRKLSDERERDVEQELERVLGEGPGAAVGGDVGGDVDGAVAEYDAGPTVLAARDRYVQHLVDATEGRRLDGLRVVVDCGHGAAFEVAPRALRELGVDVSVLNAEPDGTNINAGCGSTDPSGLQQAVVHRGAHAGLAFDGDADRVIAIDEGGGIVDGDQLLAIAALDLTRRGLLRGGVVATVMSNLGLRRVLNAHGIRLVETPVGDRNVIAAMEAEVISLGGEQSGHVIFSDLATTGDGTLTGILLLDVVARAKQPLSTLASVMTRFPQVLRNVRVAARDRLDDAAGFWAEVRSVEAELGGEGRVLVRSSGTEPVVRIMVEAPTDERAEAGAQRLAAALEGALGRG